MRSGDNLEKSDPIYLNVWLLLRPAIPGRWAGERYSRGAGLGSADYSQFVFAL